MTDTNKPEPPVSLFRRALWLLRDLRDALVGGRCPFCARYSWSRFHKCPVLAGLTNQDAIHTVTARVREILRNEPADRLVQETYDTLDELDKAFQEREREEWEVYSEEGPIRPGHKTGYPATVSICIDRGDEHKCVAMTFGDTSEEAFAKATLIVSSVHTVRAADPSRDQRMWEQGRDAAAQFIAAQKGADFYALIHKRTVEQRIRGLTYPGAETTDNAPTALTDNAKK